MPAPPESQTGTGGDPTGHLKPQSTFAVISSRRCAQPHYSAKNTPFAISTLRRMKARIQTLATSSSKSSKTSRPKDRCATHESTRYPLLQTEALNGTSTKPFDVHTTLFGRTAVRYAASRAFNLGLPALDREESVGLCDEIAQREEQGVIMWSREGTYVSRGVPKGRVTRFVETGLLDGGMEPEMQEEEEGDVMDVDMATRGAMGARALRNTMRRGRKWGWSRQDRLIKV